MNRRAISVGVAAALLSACGGSAGGSSVPVVSARSDALPHQHTFHYAGHRQLFVVPALVSQITVVARGAGGAGGVGASGGRGGRVSAVIPVTQGERLYVYVGGGGSGPDGGFNGGALGGEGYYCPSGCSGFGGGGASDIRAKGTALNDRILVVGGGGGEGGIFYVSGGAGGLGGGSTGGSGGAGYGSGCGGFGGAGGTQRSGGEGGRGGLCYGGSGNPGRNGALGAGGAGGHGHHGSMRAGAGGGGGGGGYYGGGGGGAGGAGSPSGGNADTGGGGGGGSTFVERSAKHVTSYRGWFKATGDGLVVFSW
jgi:hypothetical protein